MTSSRDIRAINDVYAELWAVVMSRKAPDHGPEFLTSIHPEQTVELSGNTDGLLLLAAYALRAAMATHSGYHEHIDEAGFANAGSLPLIISRL